MHGERGQLLGTHAGRRGLPRPIGLPRPVGLHSRSSRVQDVITECFSFARRGAGNTQLGGHEIPAPSELRAQQETREGHGHGRCGREVT